MKKLKISIIILIIIIIITSICLLFILKSSIKVDNKISINSESYNIIDNEIKGLTDIEKSEFKIKEEDVYSISKKLMTVSNEEQYFIVKDIIEEYYLYCEQLGAEGKDYISKVVPYSEKLEEKAKKDRESAQLAIYSMLDKAYINEFKVTKESISQKFKVDTKTNIILDKMYVLDNSENVSTYIVSGMCIEVINEEVSKLNMGILVDMQNYTFSIYPQEYLSKHGYNNMKTVEQLKIKIPNIEKNQYNTFEITGVKESDIFEEYFENYKYNLIYNTDEAYNRLDKDYADKRFGSKEKLKENIKLRKNNLRSEHISKYTKLQKENEVEYICFTNYGNTVKFKRENGILDYAVILDDYTKMSSTSIVQYTKMKKLEKARYQLQNFIKKVNTKDYNAIYKDLDNTFRKNNFKDVNELKKYIDNNFYNLNQIDVEDYEGKKYEYCIFKCRLINMDSPEEDKTLNVIINIKEGTDFTMSFSVQ